MIFYFCAQNNAVVKINGQIKGLISYNPIKIETQLDDIIELVSLNQNSLQVCFILSESFLNCPTNNIIVTDLKGGYLIKYDNDQIVNGEFKVVCQKKFSNLICTYFCDGGYKLYIETPTDFYAQTIPFMASETEFNKFVLNNNEYLAVVFNIESEKHVYIYSFLKKISLVFNKRVDSVCFDGGFTTTEILKDIAKHKISCEWQEKDGVFIEKTKTISCDPNFNEKYLPTKLIPYAFCEEYLVGGNCKNYLLENIKQNFDMLKDYLGDFIATMPPPPFKDINQIGFIYKLNSNRYFVEYFSFELNQNKICNILKE